MTPEEIEQAHRAMEWCANHGDYSIPEIVVCYIRHLESEVERLSNHGRMQGYEVSSVTKEPN